MNKKQLFLGSLGLSLISFLMTLYTSFILNQSLFSFRSLILFVVSWFFLELSALIFYFVIKKRLEEKRNVNDITPFSIKYFTTLASGFAHEINNPLTGILGSIELLELKDDYSKEYLKKKISLIKQLGYRIKEVVDEIDLINPKRCSTKVELNIISILQKIVEMYGEAYKDVEIKFINKAEDIVPVFANIFNIEKLFSNIMDNSIESLYESETIDKRIEIEVGIVKGNFLEIKFIDNGKGFRDIERALMPFFTTKNNNNRGLGLTLAYVQVLDHGGTIKLRNLDNGGAEVFVSLPVIYPEEKKEVI